MAITKIQVEFGAFNANPEQLASLQHQVEKMIEERLSREVFEMEAGLAKVKRCSKLYSQPSQIVKLAGSTGAATG